MKRGPFEVLDSKVVYENPWIKVREDKVKRPDGKEGIFGTVDYGSGVCILPFDKNRNVYLIKEYMYAIGREDIELPSGGIEEGESPTEAAKRELLEETGLLSSNLINLGVVNPLTMIINSPIHMFLALNCEASGEGEKNIETQKVTFDQAIEMVRGGIISHSGSISTIFKAQMYLEKLK